MPYQDDTKKPYSRKIVHASSAKHMVAMANSMTSKVHQRSSTGDKKLDPLTKKAGKTSK